MTILIVLALLIFFSVILDLLFFSEMEILVFSWRQEAGGRRQEAVC